MARHWKLVLACELDFSVALNPHVRLLLVDDTEAVITGVGRDSSHFTSPKVVVGLAGHALPLLYDDTDEVLLCADSPIREP